MGCCATSRSQRSLPPQLPEETAILYQVNRLGFTDLPVTEALRTLDAHCPGGAMTSIQLQELCKALNVAVSCDFEPEKEPFVRYFQSKTVGYDGFKMMMLMVLLCQGSMWEKAQGMYTHMPSFQGDLVSIQDISLTLNTIFELSIDVLPSLAASPQPVKGQSITDSKLQDYKTRLNYYRFPVWRRLYVDLVLTNTHLTLEEFMSRIAETREKGELLRAEGVRTLLYECASGHPLALYLA